jgi:hypothetical protein
LELEAEEGDSEQEEEEEDSSSSSGSRSDFIDDSSGGSSGSGDEEEAGDTDGDEEEAARAAGKRRFHSSAASPDENVLGDWAAPAVPGGAPWSSAGKTGVPRATYGAQMPAGKAMRTTAAATPAAVLGRIGGQAAAAATSAPTPAAARRTGKKQRPDAPGAARQLSDGDIDPFSGLVFIEEEHPGLRNGPGAGSRGGAGKGAGAQPLHGFRTRKQRDAMTAALYAEYNSRVFGSALPSGMRLEWNNRLTKTAGLTYTSRERCDAAGSSTTVASAAGVAHAAAGCVGGAAKGVTLPLSDAAASCAASSCFDEAFAGAGAAGRKSVARVKGAHLYKARIVLSSKVVDTPLKLAQVRVQQS